jgi:putative FmdB family regulatory protein
MPIYEYLCESCGKVNEKLQKVNDPPPGRCDECGSRKLAKLVSRSAFQLKGGGWYSDLYASRKEKAAVPGEGKEAAPAAPTPAPAGSSQPSAKAEPAPAPAAATPPKPAQKEPKKAGAGG